MDFNMVGPRMFSSRNGLDHGYHYAWATDALFPERSRPWTSLGLGQGCSLLRTDWTIDVIMVGPGMLSSQNGLDHGRHCGWAMDAFFIPG